MSLYDLHLHSKESDGERTPTEIAEKAKNAGLKAFALTDHDTVKGVREAMARAKELSLICIPGIEISAKAGEEVHILGYNVDIENEAFLSGINHLQELRRKRNLEIIRKLHAHGVKVKVYDELDGESRGRGHIAKLLCEQGFVLSRAEAFDKYIGKKAPCYESEVGVPPEEAIKIIRDGGGIPVLAHPYRYIKDGDLNNAVARMVKYGLGGIEVYYPNYGKNVRQSLRDVAKEYGLIMTGGTDYHSEEYGAQLGSVNVVLDEFTKKVLKIED